MPKKKLSLKIRLPNEYNSSDDWREEVYDVINKALDKGMINKILEDKLQLDVHLYSTNKDKKGFLFPDIDNELKDIMDAMQGRLAGSGKKTPKKPRLIDNDKQIYRVTIEKSLPPKQNLKSGGWFTIKKFSEKHR